MLQLQVLEFNNQEKYIFIAIFDWDLLAKQIP